MGAKINGVDYKSGEVKVGSAIAIIDTEHEGALLTWRNNNFTLPIGRGETARFDVVGHVTKGHEFLIPTAQITGT